MNSLYVPAMPNRAAAPCCWQSALPAPLHVHSSLQRTGDAQAILHLRARIDHPQGWDVCKCKDLDSAQRIVCYNAQSTATSRIAEMQLSAHMWWKPKLQQTEQTCQVILVICVTCTCSSLVLHSCTAWPSISIQLLFLLDICRRLICFLLLLGNASFLYPSPQWNTVHFRLDITWGDKPPIPCSHHGQLQLGLT